MQRQARIEPLKNKKPHQQGGVRNKHYEQHKFLIWMVEKIPQLRGDSNYEQTLTQLYLERPLPFSSFDITNKLASRGNKLHFEHKM